MLELGRAEGLREGLQRCAESLVRHIDAAFARIWTVNDATNTLELEASAGMYTHIDGGHARVPVGKFKIGRIAQENQPHLTNDVSADSWVGDKGWARREGMVAFPGYPLSLGTQVLGVVAAFRRNTFTEATLATFKAVAGGVAQFIQRKRVEESRNLLASIVDGSDEAIVGRTLDGTIVSWNGGATRLYGYSAEEILGRPVSILVPPGNLAELSEINERVERSQSVERLETVRRQKDGQLIDVSLTVSPIRDVSGRVTGASSISRNITRRKRAEEALRRAESRFRRLVDSDIIGIFTGDATGHIVDANEAFLRMLGYTSEELQAGMLRWDEITPPEHHGVNARIHQQLVATGAADPVELEYIRRDGSRVSCLVGLASLESSAEHAIGFCARFNRTEESRRGPAPERGAVPRRGREHP